MKEHLLFIRAHFGFLQFNPIEHYMYWGFFYFVSLRDQKLIPDKDVMNMVHKTFLQQFLLKSIETNYHFSSIQVLHLEIVYHSLSDIHQWDKGRALFLTNRERPGAKISSLNDESQSELSSMSSMRPIPSSSPSTTFRFI